MPGECLTFDLIYHPRKTGPIEDSLYIVSCAKDFIIPISAESLPRNISFIKPEYDFGEVCIGDTALSEIDLLRNEDPVPLEINNIYSLNLTKTGLGTAEIYQNITVPPHTVLKAKLQFVPPDLGMFYDTLVVYHSNQQEEILRYPVKGSGMGTFVDMSHESLLFIPEIKTRSLRIKNTGEDDLKINKVNIIPPDNFGVITPMPVHIPAGETDSIEINWKNDIRETATLSLEAEPCLVQKFIEIGFFEGSSIIAIPRIEADPRGDAVINIEYENFRNMDYAGERFCEVEFTVNPRLFLPEKVETDHGTAGITKNQIEGDRRIVGFRVEGDFPEKGTLARVIGPAGIAEADSSALELVGTSIYWGEAVDVTTRNGQLVITGLCGDRRILQNEKQVSIVSINPNPAGNQATIIFDSMEEGEFYIEVYDNLGRKKLVTSPFRALAGRNEITINLGRLRPGTFRIVIRSANSWSSKMLVIIN
jgi:hypothetical protein